MTSPVKTTIISQIYKKDFNNLISDWYINHSLNTIEISEKISAETKIKIAPRSIQKRLKKLHITRSYSDAFKLAIAKGRKDYTHLAKPIKANELRKGINLKTRYEILKRDNFQCVLCGQSPENDNVSLVIDHILPITRGGANEPSNLRTLCQACNHGKMISEHEK